MHAHEHCMYMSSRNEYPKGDNLFSTARLGDTSGLVQWIVGKFTNSTIANGVKLRKKLRYKDVDQNYTYQQHHSITPSQSPPETQQAAPSSSTANCSQQP
jgi:hypothetical protein